ncbi:MAG: pyruvate ferredoxin oxidoreductase [Deltaproteobacteria bacterium]|nr:pyruvate ferredoxin oxidoreductase [Deltaproteobacteria bacterium]
MIKQLCTANYAGGWTFSICGNANRNARGCGAGIYPITPQTEVVETMVDLYNKGLIKKGRIFHVESEHSALAACIGMSMEGARAFTATSSNGALYMAENIVCSALLRLPIVMQIVNRTLGPEWNIWAEQGESLLFRDWGWIQIYCEDNQEFVDHILMAFYISENHKVLLPSMLCVDAFILSHTLMPVLLPTQEEADQYLPSLDLPHRLKVENPCTVGGLSAPRITASHRYQMEADFANVFPVYREAQDHFEKIFHRRPTDPVSGYCVEDAEVIVVASATVASTVRKAVDKFRAQGKKVGLLKFKMLRPFPTELFLSVVKNADKIAVIDRNFALGAPQKVGGIFCQDIVAALGSVASAKLVQSYILGIGGLDVTGDQIDFVINDIFSRSQPTQSLWGGL